MGYEGTLDRSTILHGLIEATRSGIHIDHDLKRDLALDPLDRPLSNAMDFEHVIYSYGDGRHIADVSGLWAPYACADEDENGVWLIEHDPGEAGWALMSGYSGQHGYSGPWMHESEFIGGRMAEDILSTPGLYVAIYPATVDFVGEVHEPDTWAVAYISENIPGSN